MPPILDLVLGVVCPFRGLAGDIWTHGSGVNQSQERFLAAAQVKVNLASPVGSRRCDPGFTLVELMITVLIVALLAMVALSIYPSYTDAARMSEGIVGCGMIHGALRFYKNTHNGSCPVLNNADGNQLTLIQVYATDLSGRFFDPEDYKVNSDGFAYTVKATLPSGMTYILDQDGNELGTFTTE